MMELLTQHWISLIFGLISAGALAYARYVSSQFKKYKKLQAEDEQEKLEKKIKEFTTPLQEKLNADYQRFEHIKYYFRYIIIEECERLLEKEYMTAEEYQKLSETFKAYHGIGGNSQAEEYYHKAIALPVRYEKQKKGED